MKLTCFKAYDIRGRLGVDLDEEIAGPIGCAFAQALGARTVVLGRDVRASSEALADRVAIMKSGRLVANETPASLIAGVRRGEEVRLRVEGEVDLSAIETVEGVAGIERESGGLTVRGGGRGWIARLVAAIDAQDAMLVDLSTRRPSLEDVYLQLTGEDEYEPEDTSTGEDEPEDTSAEVGP